MEVEHCERTSVASMTAASPPTTLGCIGGSGRVANTGAISRWAKVRDVTTLQFLEPRLNLGGCFKNE